jgi:hypothetical protein
MKTFSAEELFRIIEVSQNFPLNLKFELKDFKTSFDFSDPIIYSILFDRKIIYIGYSFEDKQKDIRKSRWTKQLETILFRGYRVGLNKKTFEKFDVLFKNKLEQRNYSDIKIKKKDVMTSVNRINFAAKNWNEIKAISSKNDSLLKRISFQIEVSSKSIQKQDLQERVKELIVLHKPRCNG